MPGAALPDVTTYPLRVPLSQPQALADTGAVVWQPDPDPGAAAVVLAHGAGSDMTHPVLVALGRRLAAEGHPVLTFNFPYAEAGRRRPDPQGRLERAFADALGVAGERFGQDRPLVLGGRSMGGRVASGMVADGTACAGLVLLGYPLHPAGRPERLRTAHWPRLRAPVLFVQGDRDALCDLALLGCERSLRLRGVASTVHVLAGADHGYRVRRSDGRTAADVLTEVADVVATWVSGLALRPTTPPGAQPASG